MKNCRLEKKSSDKVVACIHHQLCSSITLYMLGCALEIHMCKSYINYLPLDVSLIWPTMLSILVLYLVEL